MTALYENIENLCKRAKNASLPLSSTSGKERYEILVAFAKKIEGCVDKILSENKKDLDLAERNGISKAFYDRLLLTKERISDISVAIINVAGLEDVIGKGEVFTRPNGLKIQKIRVPLGLIGIIYEARPNVTPDAISLCLKSGNSVILRGGKEAINSNKCFVGLIKQVLSELGYNPDCVALIEDTTRESADILMKMRGYVDVLIPRGGKSLIKNAVENSSVPVIETGSGMCHLYVDSSADIDMALKVAVNAKCSRPSVCNAVETILVDSSVAKEFTEKFYHMTRKYNLELRGCEKTCRMFDFVSSATKENFATEYDDYIVNIKITESIEEAIDHIRRYSTGHSEAIITENARNADLFVNSIDSCALYVNASTRFTDGGEFGLGAEIGISTQKLHARGPMGLSALTTIKYIIKGDGNIR